MFIKPDYNLKSIYEISIEDLKNDGVEVVLFDLDSTIMASKSGCYTQKTKEWLDDLQKHFKVAVVSNNTKKDYIEKVKCVSDFPLLFCAHKPDTKHVKNFLCKQNFDVDKCVLVGDRPLTDILCGKLLGCKTILVDSITAETEAPIVRFVRQLERLSIRK